MDCNLLFSYKGVVACGDFNNYFNGENYPSTEEREGLREP